MTTIEQENRPHRPAPEQDRDFGLWRSLAIHKAPYLAALLFEVQPLDAPGLRTMGVDRSFRLYIDFEHVTPWGNQMCSEVLLHEAMHLMWRHGEIAEQVGVPHELRKIWNYAADASGNDDLRDLGARMMAERGLLPENLGLDDYGTATDYFLQLKKLLPSRPSGGGNSQATQQSGQTEDGAGAQEPTGPGPACGGGSGAGVAEPWELSEQDTADGYAPPLPRMMRETIREQVVSDMESHMKNQGDGPAQGLEELRRDLHQPSSTPWERILARFCSRARSLRPGTGAERNYSRRSRRRHNASIMVEGVERRVFIPARATPAIPVVLVRDKSASMRPDEREASNREVLAVLKRAGVEDGEVLVADVDVEVAYQQKVRSARDLTDVEVGGGTDMIEAIRWANGLRPLPACVVVLTDGGTDWPQEKSRVPVIACVVGQGMTTDRARAGAWGDPVPDHITVVGIDSSGLAQ